MTHSEQLLQSRAKLIEGFPPLSTRALAIAAFSFRMKPFANKWKKYRGLYWEVLMVNKEKLRQRFLSDPLPVRLGGLSATLGRISSSARVSESPAAVVAD